MSHILQNIVFPAVADLEVRPLYVGRAQDQIRIVNRKTVEVARHTSVSFGAYFGAFPLGYWRHWTNIDRVQLRVSCTGRGQITLHRSDAAGERELVESRDAADGYLVFDVDMRSSYGDGGWLWFEVVAETDLIVTDAAWTTESAPVRAPRAALGITTFNKPEYCAKTLQMLAQSPGLVSLLDRVLVVDQGDRHPADDPRFAEAATELGDVLTVIQQPNLGGSGGYARSMLETLKSDTASFLMLMDDDVEIEPESIRRAVVFGAYCKKPTIVGGHMFDLLDRTKLYAWAEVVDEVPFMWRTLDDEKMPIDFGVIDVTDVSWLHERKHADYNGWWMSLIPREAIEQAGLPLPAFIKWDDAEYSLRARDYAISTVSLPGVALWHVSWVGKDDLIDWQAYFHARNRIVTALLHSSIPRGGTLLTHSIRMDLKHFASMQYFPVALRHRALRAVLSGPDHMHRDLTLALPAAQELTREYPEMRAVDRPVRGAPLTDQELNSDMPRGSRLVLFLLRSLASQWMRTPRPMRGDDAEVAVTAEQARWWRMACYDSAVVRFAATQEDHLYVRDRRQFRAMMRESVRLHRLLRSRWKRLSAEYRAADLVSSERWRATLRSSADVDS